MSNFIDLITFVETILTATTQDQPRRVEIVIRSTLSCDSLDCKKKKKTDPSLSVYGTGSDTGPLL